jgi:hypothetical protein
VTAPERLTVQGFGETRGRAFALGRSNYILCQEELTAHPPIDNTDGGQARKAELRLLRPKKTLVLSLVVSPAITAQRAGYLCQIESDQNKRPNILCHTPLPSSVRHVPVKFI